MGKTQKLKGEEKVYEEKFKKIPPSFLKTKGIKYLRNQVNIPIGQWEKRHSGIQDMSKNDHNFHLKSSESDDSEEESHPSQVDKNSQKSIPKRRESSGIHTPREIFKASKGRTTSKFKKQGETKDSQKDSSLNSSKGEIKTPTKKTIYQIIKMRIQKTFEEKDMDNSSAHTRERSSKNINPRSKRTSTTSILKYEGVKKPSEKKYIQKKNKSSLMKPADLLRSKNRKINGNRPRINSSFNKSNSNITMKKSSGSVSEVDKAENSSVENDVSLKKIIIPENQLNEIKETLEVSTPLVKFQSEDRPARKINYNIITSNSTDHVEEDKETYLDIKKQKKEPEVEGELSPEKKLEQEESPQMNDLAKDPIRRHSIMLKKQSFNFLKRIENAKLSGWEEKQELNKFYQDMMLKTNSENKKTRVKKLKTGKKKKK
eukprot:CAMPEP_0197000368 /NCGR_PEP_ID=MMETSP1380-20130617/5333_1 /TAXON_ID=5936 /ORGANISM="Euplotes crassus, Strain CT5" /LENGTH=428 /DNA_ID=CAMNT_0042417643 /DNA_START=709 /DNA_END=1992 /DNA_ORIENTATION=+